jgi:tetratricopeptide (TPR) repeat protein/predicted amidohydrolase
MASQHYSTVCVPVPGWRLPSKKPRVLLAQLCARFQKPSPSNGRIRLVRDEGYIARLYATLEEMKRQDARFLVFPEFAWPFENHRQSIDRITAALPKMGACIAPFEHLSLDELKELARTLPIDKDLARRVLRDVRESVSDSERARSAVNVAVILVRSKNSVKAFLQPKTRPAGLEERGVLGTRLAGGRKRYILQGEGFRVAVAVCFDFIARDDAHEEHPREAMLEPPDILFVPECNPSPLHEAYARAVVDLFEEPRWARAQAVVVFANVARGSELPAVSDARFGFSRVVGPLGTSTPPLQDAFVVKDGIVAHPAPVTLAEVECGAQVIESKAFSWLIARPEQSLLAVEIPTMGAKPARDPVGGRTHTEVHISRWAAGASGRWHGIRGALAPPGLKQPTGVPQEHLAQLVNADEARNAFLTKLYTSARPLWVFGDGGIGKTATVANALHSVVERAGSARVVWLDMAGLPARREALAEALLLELGLLGGLGMPPPEQWRLLAGRLRSESTIVVLDSFERWGVDDVPSELQELHGWPVRIVVTARVEGPSSVESLPIAPLPRDARLELLRRVPGHEDIADLGALETALGSTPLGIVWFEGLMRTSRSHAMQMVGALRPGSDEEAIFNWCVGELNDWEAATLSVLHELPAPVATGDVCQILDGDEGEIQAAIRRLRLLNLVTASAGELHARHPYVRQFWARSPRAQLDAIRQKLEAWATSLLGSHGGDRNWSGYELLEPRWWNIRSILDRLQRAPAASTKRDFLGLWRQADYFLWSTGRLRERLELGRAAVEAARQVDEPLALAHALFDSVAETLWHRDGNADECLRLMDEAEAIYVGVGDTRGQALVECNRSRLLRRRDRVPEAQVHAVLAVKLAKRARDVHTIAWAMNTYGNVLRDRQRRNAARFWYHGARGRFHGVADRELEAVVERNLGRCAMDACDYAEALERFESAMEDLRGLGLPVEEAEVAMYRAQALLRLGEREEAVSQLRIARKWFERVGAVARVRETDAILAEAAG